MMNNAINYYFVICFIIYWTKPCNWINYRLNWMSKSMLIRKLIYFLVTLYSVIAFAFSLFSKEIIHLMLAPSYHEIWVYVPFLCFANVFQGIYYIYSNFLFLDRTKDVFYCTLSSAVIVIALNFVLIPHLGILGTVISAAIALIVRSIICLWLASRTPAFIRVNYFRIFITILGLFGLALLPFLWPEKSVFKYQPEKS